MVNAEASSLSVLEVLSGTVETPIVVEGSVTGGVSEVA
jgi:hypothetical protein